MDRIIQPTTGDHDGGIVLWTTGECNRTFVKDTLDKYGRGNCLPNVDHLMALKAGGDELIDNCNMRVPGQPITLQNLDRKSVGFEAVRKIPGEKKNTYVPLFSAGVVKLPDETYQAQILDVNPAVCPVLAQNVGVMDKTLDALYTKHTNALQPTQLTTAMRKLVVDVYRGTKLKDSGGVYFIPREWMDEYIAICTGIESHPTTARFTLFEYKLVPSSSGVRAIMEGIAEEITQGSQELTREMAVMAENATKMRRDGLESRLSRIRQFYDKVSYYEELLGVAMPQLHQAISCAEQAIGVHSMLSLSAS